LRVPGRFVAQAERISPPPFSQEEKAYLSPQFPDEKRGRAFRVRVPSPSFLRGRRLFFPPIPFVIIRCGGCFIFLFSLLPRGREIFGKGRSPFSRWKRWSPLRATKKTFRVFARPSSRKEMTSSRRVFLQGRGSPPPSQKGGGGLFFFEVPQGKGRSSAKREGPFLGTEGKNPFFPPFPSSILFLLERLDEPSPFSPPPVIRRAVFPSSSFEHWSGAKRTPFSLGGRACVSSSRFRSGSPVRFFSFFLPRRLPQTVARCDFGPHLRPTPFPFSLFPGVERRKCPFPFFFHAPLAT